MTLWEHLRLFPKRFRLSLHCLFNLHQSSEEYKDGQIVFLGCEDCPYCIINEPTDVNAEP